MLGVKAVTRRIRLACAVRTHRAEMIVADPQRVRNKGFIAMRLKAAGGIFERHPVELAVF